MCEGQLFCYLSSVQWAYPRPPLLCWRLTFCRLVLSVLITWRFIDTIGENICGRLEFVILKDLFPIKLSFIDYSCLLAFVWWNMIYLMLRPNIQYRYLDIMITRIWLFPDVGVRNHLGFWKLSCWLWDNVLQLDNVRLIIFGLCKYINLDFSFYTRRGVLW